ncbi:MAG: hypothetical protein KatS3mg057_1450 [Herpetosiphonaceae bacterium]|nr:MAG: hypothetical protein KatS3mg057_1450 [Herpetosiphonaceae bacterium]
MLRMSQAQRTAIICFMVVLLLILAACQRESGGPTVQEIALAAAPTETSTPETPSANPTNGTTETPSASPANSTKTACTTGHARAMADQFIQNWNEQRVDALAPLFIPDGELVFWDDTETPEGNMERIRGSTHIRQRLIERLRLREKLQIEHVDYPDDGTAYGDGDPNFIAVYMTGAILRADEVSERLYMKFFYNCARQGFASVVINRRPAE